MSGKQHSGLNQTERQRRRFSETFKKKKVKDIELGKVKVSEICKAYTVSYSAVYKWIDKFGSISKPERIIVESKSDTQKILALQKRIAELERMVGQKEIELTFKEKMIEIAEEKYGIEIKKKPFTKR
ncbi:transposase [Portibacter lacus]|uniref:transposase n=2 Tax=Portibacter lacus TaxID=1099794 RepID=UPI001F3CF572|nr:transposase [Portibacter lacus]